MAVVGDTSTQKETTSYLSHMRGLVKRSIIYAFGSLASPLVSLVLAPFLTRHLTRTEYGAFAVLTVTITLISGITQFGLAASFSRAYNCDYESPRDRLHVITTSIILSIMCFDTDRSCDRVTRTMASCTSVGKHLFYTHSIIM